MDNINSLKNMVLPVRVDALYLSAEEAAGERFVGATADFAKMPYRDPETGSFYHTGPNISEMLLRKPFESSGTMERGVHLHWSIPALLTHGVTEDQDAGVRFPRTPNRWLICRSSEDQNGLKCWLVESDYLSTGPGTGKVSVPVSDRREDGSLSPMPPFRYLGRVRELTGNLTNDSTAEKSYELTVVGYGEPAFAALYQNCRGVFGIHDPLGDVKDIAGIRGYTVTGWYDISGTDPIPALTGKIKELSTGIDLYEILLEQQLTEENEESFSEKIYLDDQLYHGAIVFSGAQQEKGVNDVNIDFVKTGVGNTAAEALSAITAREDDYDPQDETLLNRLRGGLLEHLDEQDGIQTVNHKLHQDGFAAVPGGSLWKIEPAEPESAGETFKTLEPGKEIRAQLRELNETQRNYDRAKREIDQLRFQLYADWYKYLMARYLPGYAPRDLELNKAVAFIRKQIELLNEREALLAKYTRDISDRTGRIKGSIGDSWELKETEAPRFWQAQDPVVAVQIDNKDSIERRRPSDPLQAWYITKELPGKIDTDIRDIGKYLSGFFPGDMQETRNIILKLLNGFRNEESAIYQALDNTAYRIWTGNTFDPLLLDWKFRYHALPKNTGNTVEKVEETEKYEEDFFLKNYMLRNGDEDVVVRDKGRGTFSQYYSGSVILTRAAGYQNKEAMKKYNIDASADNSDLVLSQALNGFNEALLMMKQILQVQVWDTMAGNDISDAFSNELIRKAVGEINDASPLPFHYYSPIRAGSLSIAGLRMVDRFGRIRDLDPEVNWSAGILARDKLPWLAEARSEVGGYSYPVPKAPVRPRITQPARLLFRWLYPETNAGEGFAPLAASPVLGWIIPNFLDLSLELFEPEGGYLGTLRSNEDGTKLLLASTGEPDAGLDEFTQLSAWVHTLLNEKDDKDRHSFNRSYLGDFLAVINRSLQNINPLQRNQHQETASLMGRPLALTRASFELELYGLPAVDQGWDAFIRDMEKGDPLEREHAGFGRVRFPIRLGETTAQSDGLVGYFMEQDANPRYHTFYSQSAVKKPGFEKDHPENLKISAEEPFTLTLLVDPAAKVHATTGVLPAKAIDIPSEYYTDALEKMAVRFPVNPLMVAPEAQELANRGRNTAQQSEPAGENEEKPVKEEDVFYLPLPGHAAVNEMWSWLSPDRENSKDVQLQEKKVEDSFPYESVLPAKIEFVEGWLKLRIIK